MIYNFQNTKSKFNDNNKYDFDFQAEKAFISMEKQWLNNLKSNSQKNNVQNTHMPNYRLQNNFLTDFHLSSQNRKQINTQKSYVGPQIDQNLTKTVKNHNFLQRKSKNQIHSQTFKPFSVQVERTGNQSRQFQRKSDHFYDRNLSNYNRPIIMSINAIKQQQKQVISQRGIHKITSSASRQKLKTSNSKDSKGSFKDQRNSIKLNPQTQRYNKYIQKQLVNINIDLRSEISKDPMPHLNPRKFGHSRNQNSRFSEHHISYNYKQKDNYENNFVGMHQKSSDRQIQKFETPFTYKTNTPLNNKSQKQKQSYKMISNLGFQRNYDINTPQNRQNEAFQGQSLTCRNSIPRQDKHLMSKTRSKSNLSKYSQIKYEISQKQCLMNCQQNNSSRLENENKSIHRIQNTDRKTPQNIIESSFTSEIKEKNTEQKKIHVLCYSSAKKIPQKYDNNFNFQIQNRALDGILKKSIYISEQYKDKQNYSNGQVINKYQPNLIQKQKQMDSSNKIINSLFIQKHYDDTQNVIHTHRNKQIQSIQNKITGDDKKITKPILNSKLYIQPSKGMLSDIIQDKLKRKPIRLTLQKRN